MPKELQYSETRKNLNRSSMVLYALEQSLGGYVRENITELNELPQKQTKRFTAGEKKVGSVDQLVQESYISEILDMAIWSQVVSQSNLQPMLRSIQ
ncbi:MAG TPA: hypothetical protein PKD64_12555 [Pirellulaceae bacterium]|nr:hypothetical protein [Pirellulaceae bacterium]HMO93018.1 hypothetical protein [Pirellulaceae bacterium]HMP67906.1 hypothetical protein [Pirellulaceae bacterium]